VGGCTTKNSHSHTDFESYLVHTRLSAEERVVLNLGGGLEIEVCMLFQNYEIKQHLIEKLHSGGQKCISHQLVDRPVLSSPITGQVGAGSQQRNICQLQVIRSVFIEYKNSI